VVGILRGSNLKKMEENMKKGIITAMVIIFIFGFIGCATYNHTQAIRMKLVLLLQKFTSEIQVQLIGVASEMYDPVETQKDKSYIIQMVQLHMKEVI
jgi:uncharacterized lipoprotein NlpE involved in copper resistance